MSGDFVDDDEFDDDFDDDDMPLAVLTPEGTPVDGQPTVGPRKRRGHAQSIDKPHKGNTKTANLSEARSANIADAQGKTTFADPGADDWRQDLANKQHGKAAAKLTSGKLTHNSGSGFGLA